MTLQLHEGLENPYKQVIRRIRKSPTYYQFLRESNLDESSDMDLQASRFGTWIKTKAVPGLQKFQQKLAPVIGLLPGGGTVNAAFDILNRPKDGSLPGAPVQPVMVPDQMLPAAPQFPQFSPAVPAAPQYGFVPVPAPAASGLPFGLTWQTLALLGLGGVVLYRTLKK